MMKRVKEDFLPLAAMCLVWRLQELGLWGDKAGEAGRTGMSNKKVIGLNTAVKTYTGTKLVKDKYVRNRPDFNMSFSNFKSEYEGKANSKSCYASRHMLKFR